MYATGIIFALLTASVLLAQENIDLRKPFQLGTTAEDTYKIHGVPTKWYVPETGRYLNSIDQRNGAFGLWPEIDDVYMRETPANLYEVRVQWRMDDRASRLRPTPRLYKLEALVDKPTSVLASLKDIAEAVEICKSGCALYGLTSEISDYPSVLVFPSQPTVEQLKDGSDLATDYKPEEAKEQWCVAIKLKLERKTSGDINPPDWSSGKVIEYEVSVFTLSYELTRSGLVKSIKICTWKP